ncbi:MAG: choice-of-anchor Q domain-containing protein [Bacteroidota bacterium]
MNWKILWPFVLLGMTIMFSCERPNNPIEEGTLTFNVDTVKFDSIFTTFLSPAERLIVRNENGQAVNISRIWLEDAPDTDFSMIVDGIEGEDVEDIVIPANDSITIFINHKSDLLDGFIEEYINFQIGNEMQRMLIRGFVLDAYFYRARIIQDGNTFTVEGNIFDTDQTLPIDKPIVMDGPIFVTENAKLTILPGTEIFFTPYKFGVTDSNNAPFFILFSTLIVNGSLDAVGLKSDPIVFTGTRLEDAFRENPAQWRGIRFGVNSRDNVMEHCLVKNALIGVQVDSISINQNPKLRIQYSEIRNMGAFGVYGLGFDNSGTVQNTPPAIFMENCVVNTCKERTVLLQGGGKYAFYNNTFANYSIFGFTRRTPQISVNNYRILDGTAFIYPTFTDFVNCAIWGSEEDEFVIDTLFDAPFDRLILENCLVRLSEDNEPLITPHLRNSLVNMDPLFMDFLTKNYRLNNGSPAIDAGIDFPVGSSGYEDDFRRAPDSLRSSPFDIGAFEYIE